MPLKASWCAVGVWVCMAGLAGCASPNASKVEGLAAQGKAYTSTLKKVNDFALAQSLEFTADLLPNLPRDADTLEEHTQAMRQRHALLQEIAAYLDVQAAYFVSLEALAKGDTSEATKRSLRNHVEAFNKLPQVETVPRAKKDALTNLAEHIARWHHHRDLEEVLRRDADAVAQALWMNQQLLDEQIRWLEKRATLVRQVNYRERVYKPYVGNNKLGEAWKKAWISDIEQPHAIALLQQAKSASADMQDAWLNLLRGQADFGPLANTFADIHHNMKQAAAHMAEGTTP
ncbi:MAG TPA: hypothetical protein VFV57_01205 [Limnobacter sp.]|nr:hypothetical protein [Limnobacter sp.]